MHIMWLKATQLLIIASKHWSVFALKPGADLLSALDVP